MYPSLLEDLLRPVHQPARILDLHRSLKYVYRHLLSHSIVSAHSRHPQDADEIRALGGLCSTRLVSFHFITNRPISTLRFTYCVLRTIPAVAFRLFYLYRLNYGRIGHEEGPAAIATAVAMNTSIMITCFPFLKPLMEQLQPGWATSDIRHGVGYNLNYGKKSRSAVTVSNRFPVGSVVASGGKRSKNNHSIGLDATVESIELGSIDDE